MKPTQTIRRKITNFLFEYKESFDNSMIEAFKEICEENELKPFIFAGYILQNGFSQNQ